MPHIRLNQEWSQLMDSYEDDHRDPRNQACHKVGIPLIAGSLPVGASIVGLPLAAAMFTTGWTLQFVGHAFEGKRPSFVSDKRALVVGLLWWMKKVGVDIETTQSA
ncbi:Mpo1-like protein [Haliangium ochraceum]|uniref:DUF962 domain-containing protein n=1 Tax=Haliangium ochraceum (strain DSM 14365 / JCM 11303 / SMP-2) TaxID=502025 RepID=D0LFX4_HALO1|nr:DUF962 domain-containing protein [Haliangium ochraceum]ACY14576.1 conserved hypothetical protein [Haliangium ochraceum DSM 14365]